MHSREMETTENHGDIVQKLLEMLPLIKNMIKYAIALSNSTTLHDLIGNTPTNEIEEDQLRKPIMSSHAAGVTWTTDIQMAYLHVCRKYKLKEIKLFIFDYGSCLSKINENELFLQNVWTNLDNNDSHQIDKGN